MGFNANVLKMDKFGNVKPFTFILSTKNYKHLGQLNNIKFDTPDIKEDLASANELSFEAYKKIEDEVEKLWNDITDLKSIYVPELDEYFEIQVTYNDKLEETKTVICKSLCESELSQTYIYGTEINTQTDSDRLDYTQTIFYDELNPKGSLLHRILSFVPQYKIKHVDTSLSKLQRSFSIDGTTVYDFLTGECAEQFNCLFVFDSTDRSISAYDLYTSCNECGHRDAYSFVCPKCGSTNINYFGNDTDVYIDKENFSDDIKLEVDVDSIKNCLRLRSGDDIMDEAIISMNPNGTRYIYYISDEQREDMSAELVNKIDEYDELVEQYTPEYQDLALDIRELQDRKTYYESTMMPSPIEDDEEIPGDSISNKELAKLIQEKLSPVGMDELTTATTLDTVDIVVKNYAKVFVNSSLVKIDVVEGSTFTYKGKDKDDWDYGIWTGRIKLTTYSDANDVAITDTFTLIVHDNYGEFLQQKVMKEMALNDKEGSVFNVLDIEDFDEFKLALEKYCLSRLRSFHIALDTACTTLVSFDQATENADWYEDIYVPYHNKLLACSDEILIRESQIKEIQDQLDILYARKSEIQSILNFEDYLGEELYVEFCTYRREGEYQNDNYISDGLSNAEIIDRAKEFIEVAKKELIRSATKKYTISTNLYNLLLMEEFKPLANKFALGNFIRVRVGKDLFRLRLNSYHLTFSDLSTIDVEFSDMTKSVNVIDATQKILSDAQSMASNISYISKQAGKGEKANESVNNIVQNGLDSALTQIQNNVNQEFVIDNNGILGRQYNDITGKYSPEQIRITHNIIALTENNWVDTTCALGKHKYTYYDEDSKTFKQSIGFGLSSKFSQNAFLYSSQIIGGDIFSENYSPTTGTHINLNDGSFNFGHKIIYDAPTNKMTMKGVDIEWSSSTTPDISDIDGLSGNLSNLNTAVTNAQDTANSAKSVADNAKTLGDNLVDGLGFTKISNSYVISPVIAGGTLLIGDKTGTYAQITEEGILNCVGANISGTVYATDGEFTGKIISLTGSIGGIDITSDRLRSRNSMTEGVASTQYEASIRKYNPEATNPTTEPAFLLRKRNYDGTNYDSSWTHLFKVTYEGKVYASDATITGGSININNKFIVDKEGNVTLPSSATISWEQVTGTDGIATKTYITEQGYQTASQVTQITKDTVTTSYINALDITAKDFSATTITGKTISGGTVSGTTITGGSINIGNGNFEVKTSGEVIVKSGTITLGDATLSSNGLEVSGTKASKLGCVSVDGNSLFIGSWNYGNSDVSKNSTPSVFMCKGSDYEYPLAGVTKSGWAFGAGDNFGVTKDGEMYCKTGKIGDLYINSEGYLYGNGSNHMEIYPSGKKLLASSYIFYIIIYEEGQPVGGLTSTGWQPYSG